MEEPKSRRRQHTGRTVEKGNEYNTKPEAILKREKGEWVDEGEEKVRSDNGKLDGKKV